MAKKRLHAAPLAVSGFFLQEGLDMAWWTNILFFKKYLGGAEEVTQEGPIFSVFRRAIRHHIRENLLDILYYVLAIFTYLYLALAIATFFFTERVPAAFPHIVDILSEPYLGALGIYVVVKEMEKRRGRPFLKHWGELFAFIWFAFLIV